MLIFKEYLAALNIAG